MFGHISASVLAATAASVLANANRARRNTSVSTDSDRYCESSDMAADINVFSCKTLYQDDAPPSSESGSGEVCIYFPSILKSECMRMKRIECMISGCKDRCPRPCAPYTEFGYYVAFSERIGYHNAKAAMDGANCTTTKPACPRDFIKGVQDFSNYDSNRAFFYNLDSISELPCKYDTGFMSWFVSTYAYYLELIADSANYTWQPSGFIYKINDASATPINLFCCNISKYRYSCVISLFNEIITDLRNSDFNICFINTLLAQLISYADHCRTTCPNICGAHDRYTTFESYVASIRISLEALRFRISSTVAARQTWAPQWLSTFAVIPYMSTLITPPGIPPTPAAAFMLIGAGALNMNKVVTF